MKRMKKFLAILLAAVMVMSMGSMSVMAGQVSSTQTYTITVNSSLSGRTYKAYQLFTGDMDNGKLVNVVTGNGVDVFNTDGTTEDLSKITALTNAMKSSTLAINKNKTGYDTLGDLFTAQLPVGASAAAITDVLATYGNENLDTGDESVLVAFANVVYGYKRSEGAIEVTSTSNSGKTYNFSGLAAGYYLIVDETISAGVDEAYTRYMLVMTSESNSNTVTINSKEEVPTLTKKISDGSVSTSATVGDILTYEITTSVPDTTGYSSYTYIITDTLDKSLDLVTDSNGTALTGLTALSISIKLGDTDLNGIRVSSADDATKASNKNYYYYTTSDTNGVTTLTIVFNDFLTLVAGAKDGDAIVTTYTAELTSDAVIGSDGNTNTAYLTYSNNPYGDGTSNTTEDKVTVYTYEIDFTKVDSASTSNTLSGAEFYLEKTVDQTTYYAVATATFTKSNNETEAGSTTSGNTYTVTSWVTTKDDATKLITGSDGVIKVKGLGAGTFYLEEVTAPNGYVIWSDPATIVITATTDSSQTQSVSAKVDSKDANGTWSTGVIKATITNSSSSAIPSTGGIGTTIFYLVGTILVLGAAVILVTRRRMAR